MHGDFSRVTFDPSRHFSRVLTQQGRVSVDAEPNEQAAILLHYVRRLIADLVGEHGVPNPDGLGGKGFSISLTQGGKDFDIGWGRYYVDGVLVENESLDVTYFKQPDYFPDPSSNPFSANFLAYLDVWERHVTFRDRPDLLEVALGDQIDTCSRAQVVWQVKLTDLQPDADGPTSQELEEKVQDRARASRPQLRARVKPGPVATTPCEAPPSAGYRGAENQLYRVEVHNSGTAGQGATFKWSRDNGAVTFGVVSFGGTTATLDTLGRDPTRSLDEDDIVELLFDKLVLHEQPGFLFQVTKVHRDLLQVELKSVDGLTAPAIVEDDSTPGMGHPILRRWDYVAPGASSGAISVAESNDPNLGWLEIEDEVQVQFLPLDQAVAPARYNTGDYWLVPARTATGDVEWPHPGEDGDFRTPNGVQHAYAPLAFWDGTKFKGFRRLLNTTATIGA